MKEDDTDDHWRLRPLKIIREVNAPWDLVALCGSSLPRHTGIIFLLIAKKKGEAAWKK